MVTVPPSALAVVSAAWFPAAPLKVGCSETFVAPLAGAAIVTVGEVVSITNVFALLVPAFPAPSACDAWAVYCAFAASEVVGATDQEPPLSVVVRVCSSVPLVFEPEKIFTVTVVESALCVESAAWFPAVPENVGLVLFVKELFTGAVRVTDGETVS